MHNLTRVAGIMDRFPAELDFATPQFIEVTANFINAIISEVDLRQYSIVPHRLRPTSLQRMAESTAFHRRTAAPESLGRACPLSVLIDSKHAAKDGR
jgi:hypothetical protein